MLPLGYDTDLTVAGEEVTHLLGVGEQEVSDITWVAQQYICACLAKTAKWSCWVYLSLASGCPVRGWYPVSLEQCRLWMGGQLPNIRGCSGFVSLQVTKSLIWWNKRKMIHSDGPASLAWGNGMASSKESQVGAISAAWIWEGIQPSCAQLQSGNNKVTYCPRLLPRSNAIFTSEQIKISKKNYKILKIKMFST